MLSAHSEDFLKLHTFVFRDGEIKSILSSEGSLRGMKEGRKESPVLALVSAICNSEVFPHRKVFRTNVTCFVYLFV